jgi:cobalt-zinc-cadmium efflux system membrane fusion protein
MLNNVIFRRGVSPKQNRCSGTTIRFCSWLLVIAGVGLLSAHEGHRPLPTRGMEVDTVTGKMILTRSACKTLDVQTVEVQVQSVSQTLLAYGTFVTPWNRHAYISSPLTGRIVEFHVSPGQTVRAGQILAEVDSPALELLVLELSSAQTELELSSKLVESMESTNKSGGIAGIRFLEAQAKLQQDRAAVEIGRAKWLGLRLPSESLEEILRLAQKAKSPRLAISSPIDGIVTHSDLSVGKVVDPTEHLLEVLDPQTVWLKIGILEKDLSAVAEGQSFNLTLTAYPGETFRGTIDALGQFLDPKTHLGTAWATLSNDSISDPRFLPGMSGQIRLEVGGRSEKLVLPLSSVVRDGAERFVLVEEEQTQAASSFQKQTVVLGRRTGEFIEVNGGNLFPGDRVVTRGSHELGSFFAKGVLTISQETARDIDLKVEPVSPRSLAETVTVDGIVDVLPPHRALAASQLAGSIQRILVDRGQKVRRGDVMAEVVSQEFQNLQLDLIRAQLDAELFKTLMESLQSAGAGASQRRMWESESQWRQADQRRTSVRQRLKTAGLSDEQLQELESKKTLVAGLPVRAPIDGVVTNFSKVLGQVIRADESLFEIHDLSRVWVQAFVSERDLSRIHVGQAVRVRFVADSEEVVEGTLTRTGRSVGHDDRTLSVWIDLKQMPRVPIQHNMLARVTIETGRTGIKLAVPREAVVREGSRTYVFLRNEDATFERRHVLLGHADDKTIEIRQGLVAGDPIAVRGTMQLQTGYAALR